MGSKGLSMKQCKECDFKFVKWDKCEQENRRMGYSNYCCPNCLARKPRGVLDWGMATLGLMIWALKALKPRKLKVKMKQCEECGFKFAKWERYSEGGGFLGLGESNWYHGCPNCSAKKPWGVVEWVSIAIGLIIALIIIISKR
jgi:hypothetical protein